MINDFDKWEAEEAEKRKAQFEKDNASMKRKSQLENEKHKAGIGVEDGTEEFEENEEDYIMFECPECGRDLADDFHTNDCSRG